jgi:ParB-like nuclease domain
MDDLKTFPLGEVVQVPIDKIVRCRWRDEEDSPDKIRVGKERIGRQGFRGHLDGRPLPDGTVEQFTGHNRKAACLELGLTHLPMMLKAYTDEEALDIFLSDNMKEDGQSTGWALGSVRKVVPHLISIGKAKSEAHAILADKIGLKVHEVQKLAEMNDALDNGVLSPAVKRLTGPHNAVEFWRKLQDLLKLRFIDVDEQARHIETIVSGPDQRRRITNVFSKIILEAQGVVPPTPKLPKPKESPVVLACRYLDKLAEVLRRAGAEDYEYEEQDKLLIADKLRHVLSVAPTASTESDTEVDIILATMQQNEEQDNYDVQSAEI